MRLAQDGEPGNCMGANENQKERWLGKFGQRHKWNLGLMLRHNWPQQMEIHDVQTEKLTKPSSQAGFDAIGLNMMPSPNPWVTRDTTRESRPSSPPDAPSCGQT